MKLKEWFDKPEKWCKGNYALNTKGKAVDWASEQACSLCLTGALWRFYRDETRDEVRDRILRYIRRNIGLSYWNDDEKTTFKDIKKLVNILDI